ncbi:hypothetical protein SDRG_00063 [Saprolegnia diclina VS20]|uniref:F-box domain-containing protein n=1 Tax=Saprolegnia diclina (strain VS20) TaxID=1156394 RepID=T0QVR3_SAPDV|nr:hypothetical protein SDRG_00063 [Saprolegnia diclina VS20]EQC42324.1 hypothetical protein SDRG_00063 [Saprolegnia diclina VS20]|eukprot:XP_008603747.1 hypothetical protein SDRG_00063 [Saprolegnia diclina VS20]
MHATLPTVGAPLTRVPSTAVRLLPDVLQLIATYLQDSKTMYAFLWALPHTWLTPPMAALAALYEAVGSGQLANINIARLWPTFDMRNLPFIPDEFAPVFQAYVPMLPRLDLSRRFHRQLDLPQAIPVRRCKITTAQMLVHAVKKWLQQLQSLELTHSLDKLPIQHLCDSLPRLSKLRRLSVMWHSDARAEESLALLNALCDSNVSDVSLRYDANTTAVWSVREVAAFARWLEGKRVSSVRLIYVPLDDANAQVLARTLVQSRTLRSLHVDGGPLPLAFYNLGLSLPNQLESLRTYVLHSSGVPGFTQTIAGSNVRTLTVGTVIPMAKDVVMATNVMNVMTRLPRLQCLVVMYTAVPLPTVVRLSERLQTLKSLQLHNTNLDDFGFAVLTRALPDCRQLETLLLSGQKDATCLAAEYVADKIPQCPSLKTLDLSCCPIGSRGFAALLPVLNCLDRIFLIGCNIDDDGADALSGVMGTTDHLYQLDLRGNYATDAHQAKKRNTTAGAHLASDVLQHIAMYVQDNKTMGAFLSALPRPWCTEPMTALATLFEAIRSGRLHNTSMTWLWPTLDMSNLTSIPDELAPVFEAYVPMLARLDANLEFHRQFGLPQDIPVARKRLAPSRGFTKWTTAEVTAFERWLQVKSVTSVGLVDVPIDDANAQTVVRALLQSHTLKHLHVDVGKLPRALFNLGLPLPSQFEKLYAFARSIDNVRGFIQTIAGPNLRTLIVGTQTSLQKDEVLATDFMDAVTSLPRLRHLSLVHVALPLPTAVQLSKRLPGLTTLELFNTNLDDVGMAVLARVLPNCCHLETLKLSDQVCSHIAAELLAKNIALCPSLKTLNLAGSPIGSRGLIALLPVLRRLDSVVLDRCGIDDDGAAALCRAMDATDDLYQLDLSCNLFSQETVKRIIRAARTLQQSHTPKHLYVDGGLLPHTRFNLGLSLPNQLETLYTFVRHIDDVLGFI